MVRHIVTWSFKEGLTDSENIENAKKIKALLEALPPQISEIIEFKVYIDLLPSSTRNMLLSSLFESPETLVAYQVHPEHKKVSAFIRSVTQDRVCIDYYVDMR